MLEIENNEKINKKDIDDLMEDILKEMVLISNFFEVKEKQGVIMEHNMLFSPKINAMFRDFKDKRILHHFFQRVQHFQKESDSRD